MIHYIYPAYTRIPHFYFRTKLRRYTRAHLKSERIYFRSVVLRFKKRLLVVGCECSGVAHDTCGRLRSASSAAWAARSCSLWGGGPREEDGTGMGRGWDEDVRRTWGTEAEWGPIDKNRCPNIWARNRQRRENNWGKMDTPIDTIKEINLTDFGEDQMTADHS